jgi:hypothetical protein
VDGAHREGAERGERARGGGAAAFAALRPCSWDAARDLARRLPRHAFRGQPDAGFLPSSSLERAAARLCYDPGQLFDVEERMVRELQRRSGQYLLHPPPRDATLDWLALLRHHGAPTRLVDFSKSFYVACWFAIESADGDAAVWAVDLACLHRHATRLLSEHLPAGELPEETWKVAGAVLPRRDLGPGVVEVEPFQLDERLAAQQGMFLLPLDPARSFMDNLAATFGVDTFSADPGDAVAYEGTPGGAGAAALAAPVLQIVLPQSIHRSMRDDLWRMNLTPASFFPGLDGFARSLLYFVGRHQPGEDWEKGEG